MVGTILPIVYRERQQGRLLSALWSHAIGCLVGAASLGCLLGAMGALIPWPALSISRSSAALAGGGLISLLYSTREFGLLPVPILQSTWQVPEVWRRTLSPQVAVLLYGLGLGLGVATRIPVGTFYVVVIWAILLGNPLWSAVGLIAFGVGRLLPLVWMAWAFESNEETLRFTRVLQRWGPVMHMVNGLVLGFTGGSFLCISVSLN